MKTKTAAMEASLPRKMAIYGLLWLTALVMLAPLFWALVTALKPNADIFRSPFSLDPARISLASFADVFKLAPFFLYFLNTLKITLACTLGVLVTSTLSGYAFARLRFPGRDAIFMLYLGTMMVPRQVTMVPLFIMMKTFGLIDDHLSLILPGLFSVFGTFLLRQFFLTVPGDYEEAATIDGCGLWRRFLWIMLPFAKATIATLVLLNVMAVWNDFLYPMVFLNSEAKRTLTMGLAIFRGDADVQWNILMAGVIISNIPILAAFLATQRFVINGVSLSGGVKG